MSYQFLPPLSDAEYEALREDIAQNGMRHPILVDEKGKILDGHHRARIASQLGFKPEREVLAGLTEVEKRDVAFKMNAARRHMDRDARRRALHASLKADPQLTDRQHGRRVGVDHKTAAALRAEMAGRGEIPHVSTRTDAVGRQVPASRPSSPSGDGKAAARPVDDSHSDDEAPTDATSVGAGETAIEGPGVSPSVDADGEGTTTDPDGADAAGDPTDRPSAGSPVNPLAADIAAAKQEARTSPSYVAQKAIEELKVFRDIVNKRCGGVDSIVEDLLSDDLGRGIASLWLTEIEQTSELLDAWRGGLRRLRLRSVQ